jgi:hypothetical protein
MTESSCECVRREHDPYNKHTHAPVFGRKTIAHTQWAVGKRARTMFDVYPDTQVCQCRPVHPHRLDTHTHTHILGSGFTPYSPTSKLYNGAQAFARATQVL